jgi:hypothetical protein
MNEISLNCPLDSYKIFLDKFGISKEELFQFGLTETKYIDDPEAIEEAWQTLKSAIQTQNSNQPVYMRPYGGNGKNTYLFLDFYETVFGLDNKKLKADTTINGRPTKLLEKHTPFIKNKNIYNYQISHIFGKTKNIYAFTAPWNIVFMPKILDPFTGHEAKGEMVIEFQQLFQQQSYEKFKPYIDEFNKIVINLNQEINSYFQKIRSAQKYSAIIINQFEKDLNEEFSPILINFAQKP